METTSKKFLIAISAILVIISIFTYLSYLCHLDFEKTMISLTEQQLLTIAKTTANRMEEFVDHLAIEAKIMAMQPELGQEIANKAGQREDKKSQLELFYSAHKGNVDALTAIDDKGIILQRYPFWSDEKDRIRTDFTDKPGVAHVLREQKPHVSKIFYNNLGQLAISISQPVFVDKKFTGMIRWMVSLDNLANRFIQPTKIGSKGFVWLLDKHGTILVFPDHEQIGRQFMMTRKELAPDHDWSGLKNIIQKSTQGEEGTGIYDCPTCGKRLVAYMPVQVGNQLWTIGTSMNYSEIAEPVGQHAMGHVHITTLVVLLLLAGGFIFYKIEKRRFDELEDKNRELSLEVAERLHVENALHESEQKLTGIVESVTDAMCMIDEQFNVVWTNDIARHLFGPDMIGKKCHAVYRGQNKACDPCIVKQCFEDGQVHEFESEIIIPGESRKNFWCAAGIAARYEDGRPKMVVEFLHDITDRRQRESELSTLKQQIEFILGATKTGINIIDSDFNMRYIDPEWAKVYGDPAGRKCYEYFMDRTKMCPGCGIPKALKTKAINITEEVLVKEGNREVQVTTNPFRNEEGEWLVAEVNVDITERKQAEKKLIASLKEKEVLLREIHHRVKNNMQVISSLLKLQLNDLKDPRDIEIFKESRNRIRTMALVHEELYKSKDLTRIDFNLYIKHLANTLFRSYGVDTKKISLMMDIKDIMLEIDTAIPCGLIVNELVSNCLKHAFPDDKTGEIKIALCSTTDNEIEISVIDNGVGMDPNLDLENSASFGLKLVHILTDQINGRLKIKSDKGTEFQIRFKI